MNVKKLNGIAEILNEISKIKNFEERQAALASCAANKPLIQILHACFHPEVKFLLPAGAPPFKKLDKGVDAQGGLYREARKLYLFIDGLAPELQQLRRETLFVQFLEALDPDDADLLIAVKDKKMPYKGITYDLVNKTFPGLLPDAEVAQEEIKKDGRTGRDRAVPCPYGCKSSSEDGLFLPGPLAQHIKRVHGSSDDEKED